MIRNLIDRQECIEKIKNECILFKSHSYIMIGPEGSGKEFNLKTLHKDFEQRDNITILEFIDDQLVCKGEKYKSTKTHVELTASLYLGIAISKEEKNQSNLNYIVTFLKSIKNTNIVIIQPNIDLISDCARTILKIITNNREYLQDNTDRTITLICSCDENSIEQINDFDFEYTYIYQKYSQNDIENILTSNNHIEKNKINDYNKKMGKLYDISNGNFNLVNIIYDDVFFSDIEYSNSLSEIVDSRIKYIKKRKKTNVISGNDLEDIVLTCSLCVDCFNRQIIAYSTKKDEKLVGEGLQIYTKERLFEEKYNEYSFVSEEIKNILEQRQLNNTKIPYIELYNYLSKYKRDSYYERAFYLMRYYNGINVDVLSLFMLAISKSYVIGEFWRIDKITHIVSDDHNCQMYYNDIFLHYINANEYFWKKQYKKAIKELDLINENISTAIIRAEIDRLRFKCYYYENNTNNIDCVKTINKLISIVKKDLKVELEEKEFLIVDEFTLRLQILFEISPCILDDYNEYDVFEELYNLNIKINRKIESDNLSTFTTKYLLNIFNRKAFLFSNPMTSDIYYDEAKSFFFRNNILDEYCITLICYAGTLLFSSEYKKAILLCEEAYKIINDQNIIIPTPEKLFNNYYLADFLYKEQILSKSEAIEYGNIMSQKLYKKSTKLLSSPSKNVILTNVASLALYSNNIELYLKAKYDLEKSLNCLDVSNVLDTNINDFYRYHFAWFEIFYNMLDGHWKKAENILLQISDFVPALFQQTEAIIKEKNKYAKDLIAQKQSVDGYDFCNSLVKSINSRSLYNRLYYRGLPLSDLQYTSYN